MAAINWTQITGEKEKSGVRPINLRHDSRQIIKLLELVFNQELRGSARHAISQSYGLWERLTHGKPAVPGFVYEHNGYVVGNVSLLESRTKGRYLIANVAVHPDFRRRGIAEKMMQSLVNYTRKRSGKKLVLQVEAENEGAIKLYANLGFGCIGTTKQWRMNAYNLKSVYVPQPNNRYSPDQFGSLRIRPLRDGDRRAALTLDRETFPLEMNWPDYPVEQLYSVGFLQRINHFFYGSQRETWVLADENDKLRGLGTIENRLGLPYLISMRIDPAWTVPGERILFGKLVRRLRYMRPKRIHVHQIKSHASLESLILEAGFKHKRTLDTMVLDL
ncbi:MAG: GNAT family N-acetyltransferase [Chloroflexota bacterium]